MLNLEELEQFIAFADCGTLSKAADSLHISQPTITRSMKHLENTFGVSLFTRSKNRIELNETGKKAVDYARTILDTVNSSVKAIQDFDKSLKTIHVESCAPAPLWTYLPTLSTQNPSMTISSELKGNLEIIDDVLNYRCQIGIITHEVNDERLKCEEFIKENLSVCLPKNHPLLSNNLNELSLSDLNGYNCLLRSDIGFWDELCHQKMPASKFLIQTDDFEFRELTLKSSLPFFTTNLAEAMYQKVDGRVVIPISDSKANVTYYTISMK